MGAVLALSNHSAGRMTSYIRPAKVPSERHTDVSELHRYLLPTTRTVTHVARRGRAGRSLPVVCTDGELGRGTEVLSLSRTGRPLPNLYNYVRALVHFRYVGGRWNALHPACGFGQFYRTGLDMSVPRCTVLLTPHYRLQLAVVLLRGNMQPYCTGSTFAQVIDTLIDDVLRAAGAATPGTNVDRLAEQLIAQFAYRVPQPPDQALAA